MKYNTFNCMMKDIRNEVNYLVNLPGSYNEKGLIAGVIDMVVLNYFWNDKTDEPTCNWDEMSILIQNTVRHQLHA